MRFLVIVILMFSSIKHSNADVIDTQWSKATIKTCLKFLNLPLNMTLLSINSIPSADPTKTNEVEQTKIEENTCYYWYKISTIPDSPGYSAETERYIIAVETTLLDKLDNKLPLSFLNNVNHSNYVFPTSTQMQIDPLDEPIKIFLKSIEEIQIIYDVSKTDDGKIVFKNSKTTLKFMDEKEQIVEHPSQE